MDELRAMKFFEAVPTSSEGLYQPGAFVDGYLKSEADAIIESIIKGAISMFRESNKCRGLDTKSPLGRIADAAFKHWNRVEYTMPNNRQLRLDKANLLRANECLRAYLKSERTRRLTDKLEYDINVRHQKRKRCLAMAKWCECKRIDAANYRIPREKWEFYDKWQKRWLALAEEPTWAKFLQLIHKEEK